MPTKRHKPEEIVSVNISACQSVEPVVCCESEAIDANLL